MYVELKTNSVGITEVSVVPMANNKYFIQYLGQSSGQCKMAASLLMPQSHLDVWRERVNTVWENR